MASSVVNKITIIKSIDQLVGRPLVFLLPSPQALLPNKPARILFIRPGGIGDAVLLIPAIQSVRLKYPTAKIHILAEKRNSAVFSICPDVDEVFRYEKFGDLLTVLRGRYDIVIDSEQWHRLSAVVARLVRSSMSIGFATNERRRLFALSVPYSHGNYETESFLNLVRPISGEVPWDSGTPFLTISQEDRESVRTSIGEQQAGMFVALFPGGTISERQWGSDRFHELALQLDKKGYRVIVVGGRRDVRTGERIVHGIPSGVNLAGRLSLRQSAAVISLSSLLIAGDSGIMHLGYALGTKVVALFGPGIEKKWAPRSRHVIVLNKHVPCSPCTKFGYTPQCRIDAQCMKKITVQDVVNAAETLLETA
jgi:lipopolysaccharide heptosyltransferase II